MLQALFEAGIRPDLLVGCSVGALNATFVASEPTARRVAELRSIWLSITRADIFGSGRSRMLLRVALQQGHVYDDVPLRTLISRFCTLVDLADTVIPVHVVTTDLDDGVARWWSRGPCAQLLYASACLPGLLPPEVLDGHRHVDGGVLEPVPVQRAVELDATTIYVLGEGDLAAPPPGRLSALQVLLRSFAISRYTRLPEFTALAHPGQQVIVLRGASTAGLDIRDFSKTSQLIVESYELTRAQLGTDAAASPREASASPAVR
jgi:NTE family protein